MEEKNTARIPDGFDPNGPGIANGSYFGLPFAPEESSLVLIPVPWDVTVSYREGTALGPGAILDASLQVDLYDVHCPGAWKWGIGTAELDDTWPLRSRMLREEARRVIEHWETGGSPDSESLRRRLRRVNEGAERLETEVYAEACRWLDAGKTVGVVGGEHSVPLGLIRAVAERHPGLGILHVDAHGRPEGSLRGLRALACLDHVQRAARGFVSCVARAGRRPGLLRRGGPSGGGRSARDDVRRAGLSASKFAGESWHSLCERIVARLPQQVYVSFDIDGLTPQYCPHTGTPVPGGLTFDEAVYLLSRVVASGRRIVGFDLCEVAPAPSGEDEWTPTWGRECCTSSACSRCRRSDGRLMVGRCGRPDAER